MERLRERLSLAARALDSLAELSGLDDPSAVERDAAIQRFEYTFEAVWKAAQRFLLVVEGAAVGSPKACIRASRDVELLDTPTTERSLEMADDRNLTVHTYNEELSRAIYRRLDRHARVLRAWLAAIQRRLPPGKA
ncbi:MAG: nucleotidyltransferase substrate binding protein [Planctomycetota bacterium]